MFKSAIKNQIGAVPLVLLVGIIGLLAIMFIANAAPFKDQFLTSLYPKDQSHAASKVEVSLVANTLTVAKEQGFSVDVFIDRKGNAVSGAELEINFNPQFLTAETVTAKSYLPNVLLDPQIDSSAGKIKIAQGTYPGPNQPETGVAVNIKFKAKSAVTQSTPITINPTSIITVIGVTGNMIGNLNNANIFIPDVSATTFDVDKNGVLNVFDVSIVTSNVGKANSCCDFDKDNHVTNTDLNMLYVAMLGIPNPDVTCDLNNNKAVDNQDSQLFQIQIGQPISNTYGNGTYDFDKNGAINILDFNIWISKCPGASPIPTPAPTSSITPTPTPTPTPTACNQALLKAVQASPQQVGGTYQFTASSNCGVGSQYRYWLLPPGQGWQLVQDWTSSATFNWNTAGKSAGDYKLGVHVKAASNPNGSTTPIIFMGAPALDYKLINSVACNQASISAVSASPQVVGGIYQFNGSSNCGTGAQYRYWVYSPATGWQLKVDWTTSTSFLWNTGGLAGGNYQIGIHAKSSTGTVFMGAPGLPYSLIGR